MDKYTDKKEATHICSSHEDTEDTTLSETVKERLFSMQDTAYRDFQSKLMPTVDKSHIIGVRTPQLRAYAKEIFKKGGYEKFLNDLPHFYYEEKNLHGMLIEKTADYDLCIERLDRFLPYVDNWATCDLINPKALKNRNTELIVHIDRWLGSNHTYTVRFGIKMLMTHYLGDNFKMEYAERVADVVSDEYYVKMMCAWYFATALAANPDEILSFLEKGLNDPWVQNKTVQKARESLRISESMKKHLATLKK